MQAIQGYYDGTAFRPLEKSAAKPNQRVPITLMDEYVEPAETVHGKGMRGVLAQYADPKGKRRMGTRGGEKIGFCLTRSC